MLIFVKILILDLFSSEFSLRPLQRKMLKENTNMVEAIAFVLINFIRRLE